MNRFDTERRVLQRQWWVILFAVLLAVGSTLVATARQERLYRASTLQVVVPSAELREPDDLLRSVDTLDRRNLIATFARIPLTPESMERAAAALEKNEADFGDYSVETSVLPSTNVLRIEVEGPDPERTAALANALAVVTQNQSHEMYHIFQIETLARASAPRSPFRPDLRRNLVAGLVLGLILGVAAAFLAEHLWAGSRIPRGVAAEGEV